MNNKNNIVLVMAAALIAASCQSKDLPPQPAVLDSGDEAAIEGLKDALAGAMGVARIELGPEDPTQSAIVSVLPPRPVAMDDRSPVTPTQFEILTNGARCYIMRRDTGEVFPLEKVGCRVLG